MACCNLYRKHTLTRVSYVTILRQVLHKYMGTGEDSLRSLWTVASSCLFSNGKRMMQCARQCVWSSLWIAKTLVSSQSWWEADEKFFFIICNKTQGWCSVVSMMSQLVIHHYVRLVIQTTEHLISSLHVFSVVFCSFNSVTLSSCVQQHKDASYGNSTLRNLYDRGQMNLK